MPFSNRDKAVTKNLYQFKKYGSRIVTKFSKINCKRKELDTLLKDMGNMKHQPKAREWQTKASTCWRERDHCEWTGKPTKPGRPETNILQHARYPCRETGLTQCSIIQIIRHDLGLIVIHLPTLAGYYCQFFFIYISQGSVATLLSCGGIFTHHINANFPASVPVK